ncbi:MAG TPA: hypothetical protein VMK66_14000 [Myxococcales bacterium]|nr:hypothetical protein [Myxococcales bacterium]
MDGAVSVADTGACPALLPHPTGCAAEITVCSGPGPGPDGAGGNTVQGATSDGRGSLVLSCHRADVGPPQLNFLFLPTPSGFVSKAGLGVDVRPLSDGFIASRGSYLLPPPEYDFLAHDGDLRTSQKGGILYAGPDGALLVHAGAGELIAQSLDAAGTVRSTVSFASFAGSASSLMFGGAMSTAGGTLVIWQVYGEASASARWLGPDGAPAGAVFSLAGWTDSAPDSAALAGGAVAIAAQPESGTSERRWRGVIAPGAAAEQVAPAWLASRGSFFLLPGGKAMAFGQEIVASDGTLCGTVDLGAPLVGLGVDGTAFSARSEKTFRVYPRLFR